MKSTRLATSIVLLSAIAACSGGDAGDDEASGGTGGTGGTSNGGGEAGSGGSSGTVEQGGSSGIFGEGGAGGELGGSGGEGGAGGTYDGPNPCLNTTWSFTPNTLCIAPNPNCSFDEKQRMPMYAIDGDPTTRYTSGKQQDGTEEFDLLFVASVTISGVTMVSATSGDAPTEYEALYSLEGTTFMPFAPPVTGVGAPTTSIAFPPTTLKAIKIKQTGVNANAWWSINELTVTGCMRAD
jgi:hypothetical protein